MPEFVMDKEGEVLGLSFEELSPFLQGYIECMLFTETCSGISMVEWEDEENQEAVREGQADGNIPTDSGFGDIHPDSFMRMHLDCRDFEAKARHLLSQAYCRNYDRVQAGRDFWYTRNRHGVGFWDRKELDEGGLGDKLSDIARTFGEVWTSFGGPDDDSPTGYGFVFVE